MHPYTYLWDNGETTPNATSLRAGRHDVTVTDANGCSNICSVDIEDNSVSISLSNQLFVCPGEAITLDPLVTNGDIPYTYDWNGPGSFNSSSANPTVTATGNYTLIVTDQLGCTSNATVSVQHYNLPNLSFGNITIPQCINIADGTARVTAVGGNSPYSYLWDSGETTRTASALTPGSHSVTVTDANGCETIGNVTIDSPPVTLSCDLDVIQQVGPNGGGILRATGFGGIGNISYNWSNGGSTAQLNNLTEGLYTVTLTDECGSNTTCSVILGGIFSECGENLFTDCLLYTSPSPRDATLSRMPSSA